MKRIAWLFCTLALAFLAPCFAARAEVTLHGLFNDHMVLQQGGKVPVWGAAEPREGVTVAIGDLTATAEADADGRWQVDIGPLEAGGPHTLTVTGKNNTVVLKDVLVGEVWVCSGQSNMDYGLSKVTDADKEIAAADFPELRLCHVPRRPATAPQRDLAKRVQWTVCSPKTARRFSAVAYFFGSELTRARRVPVGLIQSSWGGTKAEAWTSLDALKRCYPGIEEINATWQEFAKDDAAKMAAYEKACAAWRKEYKEAADKSAAIRRRPRHPDTGLSHRRPGNLYNGMIAPLIPCAVRGVVWYQGEGNSAWSLRYRTTFPALINDWRAQWGRGDFPFLYVQLPENRAPQETPSERSAWAGIREAQLFTLRLPNTGMAISLLGSTRNEDIHPPDKRHIGERLCLAARAVAYGEDIVHSGPIYREHTIEGNKVRVTFDHVGGGLTFQGGEAKGFAIAGPDKKFVWAEASIEGGSVLVWGDEVAEPAAVRYGWAQHPVWSLMNKEGLPASPFRTDDWPGAVVERTDHVGLLPR